MKETEFFQIKLCSINYQTSHTCADTSRNHLNENDTLSLILNLNLNLSFRKNMNKVVFVS